MTIKKNFWHRNVRFFCLLLLLYTVALGYMVIKQRDFMYFPAGERPEEAIIASGADNISVMTADGLKLNGLYWPSENTGMPVIIFFHGNVQDYDFFLSRAREFSDAGYGFLLAEYRGYGGNPGKPSEEGLYYDARAYINALSKKFGTPVSNMVFIGYSLGTGVAVQMALEYKDVAGLVLQGAYIATSDVAKMKYWMFPVDFVMQDQYRSIDKIADVKAPLLMIHGARDTTIPIKLAEDLYSAAKRSKLFIRLEHAGHNDIYDHDAFAHTDKFIKTLLGQAGSP